MWKFFLLCSDSWKYYCKSPQIKFILLLFGRNGATVFSYALLDEFLNAEQICREIFTPGFFVPYAAATPWYINAIVNQHFKKIKITVRSLSRCYFNKVCGLNQLHIFWGKRAAGGSFAIISIGIKEIWTLSGKNEVRKQYLTPHFFAKILAKK